jgi:hypothetical protein
MISPLTPGRAGPVGAIIFSLPASFVQDGLGETYPAWRVPGLAVCPGCLGLRLQWWQDTGSIRTSDEKNFIFVDEENFTFHARAVALWRAMGT